MPKKPSEAGKDFSVMVPYSELCQLLDASRELVQLRREYRRLEDQVTALRMIQGECMEKIREIERSL